MKPKVMSLKQSIKLILRQTAKEKIIQKNKFLVSEIKVGSWKLMLAQVVKNIPIMWDLTPGLGRPPGKDNGNPPQYSCLKKSMDRGAWQATVHGVIRVGHDWVTNTLTSDKH